MFKRDICCNHVHCQHFKCIDSEVMKFSKTVRVVISIRLLLQKTGLIGSLDLRIYLLPSGTKYLNHYNYLT